MNLSFSRVSLSSIRKKGFNVWIRRYKWLFVLTFLILTGFVAYQWHYDLYRYHWTDGERQAYLETTAKETAFQEKKFRDVLARLERDQETHTQTHETERDLFAGAKERKR